MPLLLPSEWDDEVEIERGEHGRVARIRVDGSRWALLADTHLSADPEAEYDGQSTLPNVLRALQDVAAANPDGVIVAGDLAWSEGLAADYERVAETFTELARDRPVAFALGNHDRRDRALARFHPEAFSLNEPAKLITVIEAPAARFVLLDSLYRTDVVPGLLGQAQRDWLCGFLDSQTPAPTILVVHHPLREDDGALLDGDRLLRIVQPRSQVKAILTAHDHVWRAERRRRLHVTGLPSAGFSFLPASVATGWVEVELEASGARLRPHGGSGREELWLEWRA